MSYTRLIVGGVIPKPIPQAVKDKWTEIKQGVNWLRGFAVIINPDKPNEERPFVSFSDDYVTFGLNFAIPNPLPQQVIDRLPQIRQAIRWLMGFTSEGKATFHECFHDQEGISCGPDKEI